MKPHFDQIIRHVNLIVASHYDRLLNDIIRSTPDELRRMRALLHVGSALKSANEIIEDFSDLIARYYPELAPMVSSIEELHSL